MEVRIYYEDTDAAGVVYNANYLRYLERARTEHFRALGLSVKGLHDQGIIFPVVRMEIDFKGPAQLDDLLRVRTELLELRAASLVLKQEVIKVEGERLLVSARVTLGCVNQALKARRIPPELRGCLGG